MRSTSVVFKWNHDDLIFGCFDAYGSFALNASLDDVYRKVCKPNENSRSYGKEEDLHLLFFAIGASGKRVYELLAFTRKVQV